MTRNDDHLQDAVPTQKLEWVTPKISLMEAGETSGKNIFKSTEPPCCTPLFWDSKVLPNLPTLTPAKTTKIQSCQ